MAERRPSSVEDQTDKSSGSTSAPVTLDGPAKEVVLDTSKRRKTDVLQREISSMIPTTAARPEEGEVDDMLSAKLVDAVDASEIHTSVFPEFSSYLAKIEDVQADLVPASFYASERKRKQHAFKCAIDLFKRHGGRRTEHVEFIKSALEYMKAYGVDRDLEAYRQLVEVMPKGKYVIQNIFQSMFMHYPQQQYGLVDVMKAMQDNHVLPDREFGQMLKNITGFDSRPFKMYALLRYWMPRIININPWPVPLQLPEDSLVLAQMAIKRIMSRDPLAVVDTIQPDHLPPGAYERTWIVSGQSPKQKALVAKIDKVRTTLFVEGPFRVWLRDQQVNYFVLRGPGVARPTTPPLTVEHGDLSQMRIWTLGQQCGQADKNVAHFEPSVHEQEDGTIYACCATGTSSRDSLLSWIRLLETTNKSLQGVPILFSMTSPLGPVVTVDRTNLPPANAD